MYLSVLVKEIIRLYQSDKVVWPVSVSITKGSMTSLLVYSVKVGVASFRFRHRSFYQDYQSFRGRGLCAF